VRGAHSKITLSTNEIVRFAQVKHPKDYLNPEKRKAEINILSEKDLILEFMLNALRLTDGIALSLFEERTGLTMNHIENRIEEAKKRGLLASNEEIIYPTPLGKRFLSDLVELFL